MELGIYPETEWEVHRPFLDAANNIADSTSYSPFILSEDVQRIINDARSRYSSEPQAPGYESPAVSMKIAAGRIRAKIRENLSNREGALQEEFDVRVADQEIIDSLKAQGKAIPAGLIRNTFYLRYYREQGMLDESAATPGGPRETLGNATSGQSHGRHRLPRR